MKPMGTWTENKETRLDKTMSVFKTFWKGIVLVIIILVASKMDIEDQEIAEAMVSMFYSSDPDCEERSADWGRETVTVCGSKSQPLTKMIGD
jgi:hypothetical protein